MGLVQSGTEQAEDTITGGVIMGAGWSGSATLVAVVRWSRPEQVEIEARVCLHLNNMFLTFI